MSGSNLTKKEKLKSKWAALEALVGDFLENLHDLNHGHELITE